MTPEGQVLKAVLDYLAARHILAFRMNTLAMPTPDGKRFIKAGVPGMADVLAFSFEQCGEPIDEDHRCYGRSIVPLWIECKAAKGKQSELQKSFQEQVEREGHRYIVARSIEDVEQALK
ncbi:MAG TPA: hypothetical protein VGE85_07320 [Terracidiphilus sp.]|jgi:hypothetical protein